MKGCVFCESEKNLNNSMNIKYEEEKITVHICDECAEEATLKTAREAYTKRRQEFDEFVEKAKQMGFRVVPEGAAGGGIIQVESTQPAQPQAPPEPEGPKPLKDFEAKGDEIVQDMKATPVVPQANADDSVAGDVTSETSYAMGDLKGKKKTRLEEAKGRGGHPIKIPGRIEDETGVTRIKITQGVSDRDIQDRIKQNAEDGEAIYGYTAKDCGFCNGLGAMPDGRTCPKCRGEGLRMR